MVTAGDVSATPARRTATLPCDPASAGRARALLRDVLTGADRLQWLEAAELACTEVITNAVLHAHTDVELTIEVSRGRLRVAVRDFNPTLPIQRRYGAHATTGRGLALVAAVTSEHGFDEVGPAGKTVWFTIDDALREQTEDELLEAWVDAEWDLAEPPGGEVEEKGAQPPHAVTLLGLPPTLWLAARQHHDALLRELVLYLTEHGGLDIDVSATDQARAVVSGAVVAAVERAQRTGTARPPLPAGPPSPLADLPEPLDLELAIPVDLGPAFGAMQDALDAAERLAVQGKLLARPGLPEIVAVRDWVCEQIMAQLAGVPASPWPGADHERFTAPPEVSADEQVLSGWDIGQVRDADRGVIAADDANRIIAISPTLAAALGWAVDDLVGRRVVTLVPPRLREAHVAGFTRHLTTGEAHALDVPLTLPVLHADGSEIQASFLVQRAPISGGRAVYLAWIEPLPR